MRFKKQFDRLSISSKLSLLIAGLIALAFTLLWMIINNTLINLLKTQTDLLGNTTAYQMAHASAELLLAEDMLSLKVIVNQVSQAENIVRAQIRNQNGQNIAESSAQQSDAVDQKGVPPPLQQHQILYTAPITFQGVTAGFADVVLDKSQISSTIDRTLKLMSLTFAVLLVLSLPMCYYLGRYWAEPINRLISATRDINAGELKTRITHRRSDEFGSLMDSFNEMANSLASREQLRTTFYRYVGSGIANQVLDKPHNPVVPLRPITATIVFIDIVSFTKLCEELSPEHVAKLLNQYYDCITQCCAEFGGIVDKFMGDGALVIFGASGIDENHAINALTATLLFLKVAQTRMSVPSSASRSRLTYRISLHTGTMLAGTLGENERLQYTVIGDAVNVAARLCQKGNPDQPILSKETRVLIPELQNPHVESLGPLAVRGRTNTIEVFQLNPYPQRLPSTIAALVFQRARLLAQNDAPST